MGDIFISYSRQQFHLAEQLALDLQSQKVGVWFDLQRLKPGLDWAAEIEKGLAACDGLILIVSQASLQSPYVRSEWERVLRDGKPLYLLIYEGVRLPPELRAETITTIDCRANYRRAMRDLAFHIDAAGRSSRPPIRQRVAAPLPFNLPSRMPLPIFWLLLALVCNALFPFVHLLIYGWTMSDGFSTFSGIVSGSGLLLTPFMLYSAWQLLCHKADYSVLQIIKFIMFLYAIVLGTFSVFVLCGMSLALGKGGVTLSQYFAQILLVLLCGLNYYVYSRVGRDPVPLVGWFPAGKMVSNLRANLDDSHIKTLNEKLAKLSSPTKPLTAEAPIIFYAAAGDAPIIANLSIMLKIANLKNISIYNGTPVPLRNPANSLHILILSNLTSVALLDAWSANAQSGHKVIILASTLAMTPQVEALSRLQWVDYRTRDSRLLVEMISALVKPSSVQNTQAMIPTSMTVQRLPAYVNKESRYLRIAVGIFWGLAIGLGMVYWQDKHSVIRTVLGVSSCLLAFGTGIFALTLDYRLVKRQITARNYARSTWLFVVSVIILGVLLMASGIPSSGFYKTLPILGIFVATIALQQVINTASKRTKAKQSAQNEKFVPSWLPVTFADIEDPTRLPLSSGGYFQLITPFLIGIGMAASQIGIWLLRIK